MKGKKLKLQRKNKSYGIKDCAFYMLASQKKLAALLFIKLSDLKNYQANENYITFPTGKNGKKKRIIECPNKRLDKVHTRIASLLCRIKTPDYLHSGVEFRSNVSNADVHRGQYAVFTTDITSFFQSTSRGMVFAFFYNKMKCSSDIANILSHICTFKDHIPTGSRISMPLAFWANYEMFENLHAFSSSKSAEMTLYVDDLTFSGLEVNSLFAYKVKNIISRFNHIAHPEKSKLYSVDDSKLITGVVVLGDEIKVRNKLLKNIHEDFKAWTRLKALGLKDNESLEPKLLGRLNAASSIDKKFKDKIRSFKTII